MVAYKRGGWIWWEVISSNKFDLIPKKQKYPKVMEVCNSGHDDWVRRVVFMEKGGRYLAWDQAETIEDSLECTLTNPWKYAREIVKPKTIELSMNEIAEKFGVDVSNFKIKK